MMGGMLALRVDKWVRVGSGLGLLLLLVAQEKVCPWLFTSPNRPEPNAATTPTSSDTNKAAQKRNHKRLPLILPDAPAPRWPGAWGQIALRHPAGARDGVVSCGRKDHIGDDAPVAVRTGGDPWAWHSFLRPDTTSLLSPRVAFIPPADPALGTCISRTGPPVI